MAEHLALLDVGAALVHVQVGTADVGRGDADEDVGGAFDPGIGYVRDGHLARTFIDQCTHGGAATPGRSGQPCPIEIHAVGMRARDVGNAPLMYARSSSWYLPLRGTPCAHCGQPAERLTVFPGGRVVSHVEDGGPPCHLPNVPPTAGEEPVPYQHEPRTAA